MPENKKPILDEFESIEAIQNFWDENSSADYWNEMEDVEMELSPALQTKLELKRLYRLLDLSSEQISAIEAKAHNENVNGKQLIPKWILEHV
jgi:hypothetical protein